MQSSSDHSCRVLWRAGPGARKALRDACPGADAACTAHTAGHSHTQPHKAHSTQPQSSVLTVATRLPSLCNAPPVLVAGSCLQLLTVHVPGRPRARRTQRSPTPRPRSARTRCRRCSSALRCEPSIATAHTPAPSFPIDHAAAAKPLTAADKEEMQSDTVALLILASLGPV